MVKVNNNIGILFPDKIIATKKIVNIMGKIYLEKLLIFQDRKKEVKKSKYRKSLNKTSSYKFISKRTT